MTDKIKKISGSALKAAKWGAAALITGGVCGLVGTVFHFCVDFAAECFEKYSFFLYILPFVGLLIALIYRLARSRGNLSTDRVLEATRSDKSVPPIMAPLIFAGTVLTHMFGGSAGREGAALQLGGSISSVIGKAFKLKTPGMHITVMCGMAALFSALFGTPVAAALFVLEVVDVGVIHYKALLPCMLSSTVAYAIASVLGVAPMRFELPDDAFILTVKNVLGLAAISVSCGLVAILFCKALQFGEDLLKEKLKNDYIRIFICGTCVVLLTLIIGTRNYNGAGTAIIARAVAGNAMWYDWLLKLVFTVITIGGGYRGGEIVPSFFVGATFGCAFAHFVGLDPCFGAALGMIAVFCGVTNTPAASIIMACELFSGSCFIPIAFAAAVSYMVSGKCSLYHSQKFLESKFAWTEEG